MVKKNIYIWYKVSQGMQLTADVDDNMPEEEIKERAVDYFYSGKNQKDFKVLYEEDGINPEIIEIYSVDAEDSRE